MIEISNILDIEKYLSDIDVVVFDLDDTLYSEKDYVKSGFLAVASKYPHIKDFAERMWYSFKNGKKPIDTILSEENLLSEKNNCLTIYRMHFPSISLYDGVLSMIKRLKKKKKMAIITDGRPESQRAKIEALNISKYFDKIIITDEISGIECRKPNPISFSILKEFFDCNYNQMVYVGDNIDKDFIAPEQLGIKTIFFNNKDGLYYKEK